jgi:GMP synthase-like glutamine amidotransferase
MMPSCLVIQHVEPERPYGIDVALVKAGVEVMLWRAYAADPLPRELDSLDGLVVMGGPMSAADDEGFPTRRQEIAVLARAVRSGMPTLGVCLGAQLLAIAAGGEVMAGASSMEVGWAPIHLTDLAANDPLFAAAPEKLTVLHWHGDTYRLPAGAVRLASSELYPEQAFRVGARAWGLQFHLEVDEYAVNAFLAAFEGDAALGGTSPGEIRNATREALDALAPYRRDVLGHFAAIVAGGEASQSEVSSRELAEGPEEQLASFRPH